MESNIKEAERAIKRAESRATKAPRMFPLRLRSTPSRHSTITSFPSSSSPNVRPY